MLVGDPIIASGGVKLLQMICANPNCQAAINIADDATVGKATNIPATVKVDEDGFKHHNLPAEGIELGTKIITKH